MTDQPQAMSARDFAQWLFIGNHPSGASLSHCCESGTADEFLAPKIALRDTQLLAAKNAEIARLKNFLEKIIEINVREATDRYGDPKIVESWGNVVVARAALSEMSIDNTVFIPSGTYKVQS